MDRLTNEQVQKLARDYSLEILPRSETTSDANRDRVRMVLAYAFIHGFTACEKHWCDKI
jgi:hypothetical protein